MTDVEKVIESLTWAVNDEDVYSALYTDDLEGVIDTMKNALTVLEAQRPKVMTLDEADNADCVWYECRTQGIRPANVNRVPYKTGVYRVQLFGTIDRWEHADEYGEWWRCWTLPPTDAQREEVHWH